MIFLSRLLIILLCCCLIQSCSKSTYPCPDIRGGTEVVKAGSPESMKVPDQDFDSNGRLVKKPYSHPGMKKKRR